MIQEQIAKHLKELIEQKGYRVSYLSADHSPVILAIDGKRTAYSRTFIYIRDSSTYIQPGVRSHAMYRAEDFADPDYFDKIVARIPPKIAFWKIPYYRLKHNVTFHLAAAGLICICYNDHCFHFMVRRNWWHWGIHPGHIGLGPLFLYLSPEM